jgi:hypothetical protein
LLCFVSFTIISYLNTKSHTDQHRNSTKWSPGKTKKRWKPFSPKNKLIQDSDANEENGYPVLALNKTKINYAKEPNEAHKNTLKKEILQEITENFMEMLPDIVNQNVQDTLKKF